MVLLCIETSTNICSVALSDDATCVFYKENREGFNHAALLSLFIEEALHALVPLQKKVDAVAVSAGPGSYTGLRIGVSTSKGLCYGFNIPLIAVDTLEIMTIEAQKQSSNMCTNALWIPMIDARRNEVYDAVYNNELFLQRAPMAETMKETAFNDLNSTSTKFFFGNGASKCRNLIENEHTLFIDHVFPLAHNMIVPAQQKFKLQQFENLAYFEPFYLKEFYTTAKLHHLFTN